MKVKRASGYGSETWISFECPGCNERHAIPVDGERGWKWNGSEERLTLQPSILVHSHKTLNDANMVVDTPRCHSFVTDGRIVYCADSTHALAGQTVDLPEIDGPAPGGAKGEP